MKNVWLEEGTFDLYLKCYCLTSLIGGDVKIQQVRCNTHVLVRVFIIIFLLHGNTIYHEERVHNVIHLFHDNLSWSKSAYYN